jgi:hypothetical protein
MEQVMEEAPDGFQIPVPLDENDHQVMIRRCEVRRQRLIPVGEEQTLNLKEAVALLAPSQSHRARANVMKLKPGYFVGVKSTDQSNFVIVNPTSDGDIRWLLQQNPELADSIRDIYLVDGVKIRRNTIDLSDAEDGE